MDKDLSFSSFWAFGTWAFLLSVAVFSTLHTGVHSSLLDTLLVWLSWHDTQLCSSAKWDRVHLESGQTCKAPKLLCAEELSRNLYVCQL